MRIVLPALFFAAFLSGCTTHQRSPDSGFYWRSYESLEPEYWEVSEKARRDMILVMNREAADPAETRKYRSEAIFGLFKYYVRPGFTSRDCRNVFEKAEWLDEVHIEEVTIIGGMIPVDSPAESSPFIMSLFPDENGYSDWALYFTLYDLDSKGALWREERQQKAMDFLKGNLADDMVRLHEFALCYPDEPRFIVERFTADHGIGLLVPGF